MKHKLLRKLNNFLNLGEVKYKKLNANCWQCIKTGVTYSDNVINIITEDFEKDYKKLISYGRV